MSPVGWRELTVDDIKAAEPHALAGGPFGSDLVSADYTEVGVPVIRGSNFAGDERRHIIGPFAFVSPAKAAALVRSQARAGDVIFTQRGTLDQVALIASDDRYGTYVISQSQMKLTCDRAQALPEYVYYWFRTPQILDYIDRHTIATGVPHINLGILKRAPITLPPLAEQAVIVQALRALDDRVSALRGLAAAAEGLFHALFEGWFVRRDVPGLKDIIGQGPGAWPRRPLIELARFQNGTAFRGVDFCGPDEGLPVIKIGELRRGISRQTRRSLSGGRRVRKIRDGDVLFAWSGNPQSSIGTFLWGGGDAWLNQHIFRVDPERVEDRAYLYGLLCRLQADFVEIARNHQTTGLGHIAKRDLRRLAIEHPPLALRRAFDHETAPLWAAILAAQAEIGALGEARDLLLPELLGGRVRLGQLAINSG
jgi:type I restriction enzyme S subunit